MFATYLEDELVQADWDWADENAVELLKGKRTGRDVRRPNPNRFARAGHSTPSSKLEVDERTWARRAEGQSSVVRT